MINWKVWMVVSVIFANACSSSSKEKHKSMMNSMASSEMAVSADAASYVGNMPSSATVSIDTKIIKNAYLQIKVDDSKRAQSHILSLVKQTQSILISTIDNRQNESQNISISLKVPADSLDRLIWMLEQEYSDVLDKRISSEDVTEEYVDIAARLDSKRKLEARYIQLLALAKSIEDMASIEEKLSNVRAEIESIEGRIRYIDRNVAYSSVNIDLVSTDDQSRSMTRKITNALKRGWYGIEHVMMWIISMWPIWILMVVVGAMYRKYRKSKK